VGLAGGLLFWEGFFAGGELHDLPLRHVMDVILSELPSSLKFHLMGIGRQH
jgi:hypothetical protein